MRQRFAQRLETFFRWQVGETLYGGDLFVKLALAGHEGSLAFFVRSGRECSELEPQSAQRTAAKIAGMPQSSSRGNPRKSIGLRYNKYVALDRNTIQSAA